MLRPKISQIQYSWHKDGTPRQYKGWETLISTQVLTELIKYNKDCFIFLLISSPYKHTVIYISKDPLCRKIQVSPNKLTVSKDTYNEERNLEELLSN